MSATALTAAYSLHGVGVEVRCDRPEVAAAMELRLRSFRGPQGGSAADVRLDFEHGDEPPATPTRLGRPVYDTPHGTLFYDELSDSLAGSLSGVTMGCEAGRGRATVSGRTLDGFELYLATHPLATIALMQLMARHGRYSLHAGCLAAGDRGVLLAGTTGAGKSTLALTLARAGLSFLSDDVVFLSVDGASVDALGFADTIGVSRFVAQRFPELGPLLDEPPGDGFPKRLSRIERLFGAPPVARCTPVAIVFPRVEPAHLSQIAPLDPREAMLRLVPDVLLTEPGTVQLHLAAIGALLHQVRCYELRSGSDLERAAELVAGVLR